jgi:hypothetical protein
MLIERMRKRLAADRASFIEPCLPSTADKPPFGSNWIHDTGSQAETEQAATSALTRPAAEPAQASSPAVGAHGPGQNHYPPYPPTRSPSLPPGLLSPELVGLPVNVSPRGGRSGESAGRPGSFPSEQT